MEGRWIKLKSLHQQILSGSRLTTSTNELNQLTPVLKVLLGLEIGQCETFPSRCLHCHQLLALTVLKMMFEKPGECQSSCSKLFTALEPVLIKNLFSKDEFIRYSTQKFLVMVIRSNDIMETDKSRILNKLCEKMKTLESPKELTINLQLFSHVMSRKNGERVNKLAFGNLKTNFPGIFETVSVHLKCNSFAHDFYTLLVKVTKYINRQPNCVDLLKEIFGQNLIKCIQILLKNLQSSDENISTRKLLDFFNILLPYSKQLVFHRQVDKFYVDFSLGFLNEMCNSGVSFNWKTCHDGFMGDITEQSKTDFPSTRRLVLVMFKAVAVVLRSNGCHAEFESKMYNFLSKMSTNLLCEDGWTVEGLNWLSVVFGEQDDSYIECIFCCLDIYTLTRLRDSFFSPYPIFFQFVETFDFDTSVVMDWLVSPETCFLLYLSRLLRVIISEWNLFVKAAHDRYPQNCGQDDQTISDDGYLALSDENSKYNFGNAPMDVSDERSQRAKLMESSDLTSVDNGLEGNDSLSEKGYTCATKPQIEVAPLNQGMDCDQSMVDKGPVSETVSETTGNSEESFQDKIVSLSQGLSAIMAYSDSDSDESNNHPSIQSESIILKHRQSETATKIKSCDNSNIASIQSENGMISSDNSKCESNKTEARTTSSDISKFQSTQSEASNISCDMKCLDRVMSLLIHVRIQIERLVNQDLFPYNPAHLLSLISDCEDLYES